MKRVFSAVLLLTAFAMPALAQQKSVANSDYTMGYQWAEERDIDDPAKCIGPSPAFIDGCKAWASDTEDNDVEDSADDRED